MNGLSFQGKTLEVSRRMFKNPEYEGLTRTEKRKLKAKRSEEKRAQGGGQDYRHHKDGAKAQDVEMTETTVGESGDKVPTESSSASVKSDSASVKSDSASAKSDSATFAKPAPPT